MKRSLIIGAATAAVLFASAPVYAGQKINGIGFNALGVNALGQNALGVNGLAWNSNQTSAAAQPGLNLTFEGVTLSNGETLTAK